MITKYHHNNIDYNTFDEIRHLFPNVSFPETITPEALAPLGITIVQDADPVYVPTTEDVVNGYIAEVQFYLDSTAQERGYDGILSLCSYATSKNLSLAKRDKQVLNGEMQYGRSAMRYLKKCKLALARLQQI